MKFNKKIIIISLVSIVVVIVVVTFFMKKKKEAEISEIMNAIDSGAGLGGADFKTLLANINPNSSFDGSHIVSSIHSAKGFWDNDEQVVSSLRGLSKENLASVYLLFNNTHGDLDNFLNPALGGFLDEENWNIVINILRSAK